MRRSRRSRTRVRTRNRRAGGPGRGRRHVLLAIILLSSLLMVGRSFQFGVLEHDAWRARAEGQHADTLSIPAPRGTIFDRDGVPLAASREVWILAVAPREVIDTAGTVKRLVADAGLTPRQARNVFAAGRDWVPVPGRFEEATRSALDGTRGIYFERAMRRFYPHEGLAAELLGNVNVYGEVAGGIEQQLDSALVGKNGLAVARTDPAGRPIAGAMQRVLEPVPGHDVVLTIDVDLQEIAQEALVDALDSTRAVSGDMVIADPHTGEILAAVSRRGDGVARSWTAATSPYEPGSTVKPFTVAALLAEGRVSLSDSVFGEHGTYRLHGRTIHDVQPHGWLTLREAFLVSSNIVLAKAAGQITAEAQFDRLRAFGFGTPTGITFPSESAGMLARPAGWGKQTPASLAFGYELAVTPLQLVMAYGAIANGGVLMEPRLVREVRARDGRVLLAMTPRAVRRVVAADVAVELRDLLTEAVEQGTGRRAAVGTLKVAGKTGTARLVVNGRYEDGSYIATFAGFFPADDPQLVFLVKLDRPRGQYYGGQTAAPVTRTTLLAALAARGTPFDRSAVAHSTEAALPVEMVRAPAPRPDVQFASVRARRTAALGPAAPAHGTSPVRATRSAPAPTTGSIVVPDVTGLTVREAARRLHARGLLVRTDGSGLVHATVPAPGSTVRGGVVVRLTAGGAP